MTINMIIELITILSINVISLLILYKTIYWKELILVIGDFSENSPILKSPIINNYMDTPTKPLLKTKKLKKKDVVAQIANKKSVNCFSQANSPNITLVLLSPINPLVRYLPVASIFFY